MKKTSTWWGLLAVVAALALATTVEASQMSVAPAVQDEIAALIQSQVTEGKTPGIAISTAKDGRTIYENAAGVRDVASKAPMLVETPQREQEATHGVRINQRIDSRLKLRCEIG